MLEQAKVLEELRCGGKLPDAALILGAESLCLHRVHHFSL